MAITRIWQSGFDSGSLDGFLSVVGSSASTTYSKDGSYSLKIDGTDNIGGYIPIPSTKQIRSNFWTFAPSGNLDFIWIHIQTSAGTTFAQIAIYIDGTILIYTDGVLRDTRTGVLDSTFSSLGFDYYGHTSSGWFKVYASGSEILSYTGNTNTNNYNIGRIFLGKFSSGAFSGTIYIDNIYIDDTTGESSPTAPPIKRFRPLNVNGDGTYLQWTPIPTGSHYLNVDERPPDDDTSYLEAITGSLYDSFNMTTFTLDTNENIIAMIPFVYAKRGSTTEQIALGTYSSGTDSIGSNQDLSTNYNYIWERQTTGSLGASWNQSYMDSVELIIKSAGTYS